MTPPPLPVAIRRRAALRELLGAVERCLDPLAGPDDDRRLVALTAGLAVQLGVGPAGVARCGGDGRC